MNDIWYQIIERIKEKETETVMFQGSFNDCIKYGKKYSRDNNLSSEMFGFWANDNKEVFLYQSI